MSSSPRFTRGTSVIAALVFAALLGAVALSLNAFNSNSASTAALPAAAGSAVDQTPTDAPATTASTPQTQSDDQACTQAKQLAYYGQQSPEFQKSYPLGTDASNVQYSCVAAILIPGKQPSNNAADYKCVGETGKLTTEGTQLQLVANPDSNVVEGQCQTQVCTSSGCTAAATFNNTSAPGTIGPNGTSPTVSADNAPSATQPYYVANGDSWCDQNGNCLPAGSTCTGDGSSQACTNAAGQPITSSPAAPGTDTTVSGCGAGASTGGVGGATTYYCGTTQDAQTQLTQAQAAGATNCQINSDGYSVTCNTQTPPPSTCTAAPNTPGCPPATPTPAPQGPCPAGTTGTAGNCTAVPAQTKPAQTSASPISSLLSGLVRGLTQQQPCYTTTTASPYGTSYTMVPQQVLQSNGTYATVYVQQPTTVASPYGTTQQPCGSQPLTQAQAPYGVGSNGVACPAPAPIQQCPTNQTPQPVSSTGNGCTTGYQCVPSSSATNSTLTSPPTAQLSCTPQVADVGESVAISYSCGNATGSSGSGFSTNNQVAGTATSSITAPPAGTNTANFSLTCNNNGQTANAQCSVQINTPAIDFVANPSSVQLGSTATIGWVTSGMQSCVVSSPQDASFTSANASSNNPNGAVQTDPITQQTEYDLTCQTLGGQTKTASTTIAIATSSPATQTQDITVSSSADGATVNHGSQVTIKWSDPSAASGSAIAIWLVDVNSQEATAVIASQQAASGSYVWNLPNPSDSCNPDSYAPCASNLVAGRSYGIEATLYTPQNAYLGVPSQAPANAVAPTYTDFGYTPNPFTIGQ